MFTYTSYTVTTKLEPKEPPVNDADLDSIKIEPGGFMVIPRKEQIPWWKSKTIWAGVAQVLVGIAVGLGYMTEGEAGEAQSWLTEILAGLVGSLGAATVWGRVMATREIKPQVLPPA